MYRFTVERTQHTIGQGGFHSSYIHTRGGRFSVIFDCGGSTEVHRTKLISHLASEEDLEHDWLVISHLDEDHINGIRQLEKAGVTFSNVFLPHVDLPQCMFLMLLKMIDAEGTVTVAQLDSILVAGQLYAGVFGRPRIVVRNDDGDPLTSELNNLLTNGTNESLSASNLLEDDDQARLNRSGVGLTISDSKSICLKNEDWKFRFYSREWNFSAAIKIIWELPILKPLSDAMRKLAIIGTKEEINFTNNIQYELDQPVKFSEANALLKKFSTKYTRLTKDISINALLKMLYKSLGDIDDYNSSSLCMYSGPTDSAASRPRRWYTLHNNLVLHKRDEASVMRIVGWLGMGDAHLKTDKEFAAFADHFRRELPMVSTLMLPHHGSRLNYDKERVQLHALLATIPEDPSPVLIVASDPNHEKYRHPHKEVCNIGKHYGYIHNVNLGWKSVFEESVSSVWPLCRYC